MHHERSWYSMSTLVASRIPKNAPPNTPNEPINVVSGHVSHMTMQSATKRAMSFHLTSRAKHKCPPMYEKCYFRWGETTYSRRVIVRAFVGFLNSNNFIILKDQQMPAQLPVQNLVFHWVNQRISKLPRAFVGSCHAEVPTKCACAYIVHIYDHLLFTALEKR